MKKAITLLLAAVMALSLTACGGNDGNTTTPSGGDSTPTAATTQEETTTPSETPTIEPEQQILKIGETVSTDVVEFTLTSVKLSQYLISRITTTPSGSILAVVNEDYYLPSDSQTTTTANSSTNASDGHTFVSFEYTVKFLGKQSTLFWYLVHMMEVDYDDGFVFSSYPSSPSELGGLGSFYLRASDAYTLSASSTLTYEDSWESSTNSGAVWDRTVTPLDATTYLIRGRIEVPIVVAENTDAPLRIKVQLVSTDGEYLEGPASGEYANYNEFIYVVR